MCIIIFNILNMSTRTFEKQTSGILSVLGNPFRVRIALALSGQEACVCHLEQLLKKRQSYISQHLMVMRDAGLLDTRRDGKYIYYRLADENIIPLIHSAARIAGIADGDAPSFASSHSLEQCVCPNCGDEEASNLMPQKSLDAAIN